MSPQLSVHLATAHDRPALQSLLYTVRRGFAAFGREDLPHLLSASACVWARSRHGQPVGLLCATAGRHPWAFLRGAAVADGWRADDVLGALLPALADQLRRRRFDHLAVYGTALWLAPPLLRAGFRRMDWIITLERHPRPLALADGPDIAVRSVAADDLPSVTRLDEAAFDPPYRLASGELIELMVTTGYFVVATQGEQLLGYLCADVLGREGQIIRLAVHPDVQGRGIGRTLLNAGLAFCSASGARAVSVNTQESNLASLRLYEGFGFRRIGRRVPVLAWSLDEATEGL
ncbi:MAG: GNAT family N-acetyltransferase [Caldilineales bacterium]|nr:GNAT family N-acetyltransferase [Caldilineales bacterium]MDW8317716.1 GNAT family N-acetyltransferase [Anaerolineae bacterium]